MFLLLLSLWLWHPLSAATSIHFAMLIVMPMLRQQVMAAVVMLVVAGAFDGDVDKD